MSFAVDQGPTKWCASADGDARVVIDLGRRHRIETLQLNGESFDVELSIDGKRWSGDIWSHLRGGRFVRVKKRRR